MSHIWTVWNADKSEGVSFKNERDANMTELGFKHMNEIMNRGGVVPTIGLMFAELHDGKMTVEKIKR